MSRASSELLRQQMVFIDNKSVNTDAAAALGITVHHFTGRPRLRASSRHSPPDHRRSNPPPTKGSAVPALFEPLTLRGLDLPQPHLGRAHVPVLGLR